MNNTLTKPPSGEASASAMCLAVFQLIIQGTYQTASQAVSRILCLVQGNFLGWLCQLMRRPLQLQAIGLMAVMLTVTAPFTVAAPQKSTEKQLPVYFEADSIAVDEPNQTRTLEGRVILKQGERKITAEKIVVTTDAAGFHKAVANGGATTNKFVKFVQKQPTGALLEAESLRMEYDSRLETVELFEQATLKNGQDQLKGNYIWYDVAAEKFLAKQDKSTPSPPPPTQQRVYGVFHPQASNKK